MTTKIGYLKTITSALYVDGLKSYFWKFTTCSLVDLQFCSETNIKPEERMAFIFHIYIVWSGFMIYCVYSLLD